MSVISERKKHELLSKKDFKGDIGDMNIKLKEMKHIFQTAKKSNKNALKHQGQVIPRKDKYFSGFLVKSFKVFFILSLGCSTFC